jgi:hypothetical protein
MAGTFDVSVMGIGIPVSAANLKSLSNNANIVFKLDQTYKSLLDEPLSAVLTAAPPLRGLSLVSQ